ncbi:MAG: Tfp pilus assembly protein PilF, partial [Bryobacterales bacterium]|nr:Tfp pilus assembly protein PilF [Bryobacterales bacterium]
SSPPSKPPGTFDDPNSGPPNSLHSVGVRGAIDGGGYAASATAKTQTELFRQLTDVQVAALQPALDPCASSNAPLRTAISLLSSGKFADAVTALETLLRTNADPASRQLLGLAYEGSGQLEAAAEQFRLAAEASPGDAASFAYGSALLLEGEADRAEAIFRKGGPAPLARLGLGAAVFQHGNVIEALRLFLDAAAAQPSVRAPFGFIAVALGSAPASASSDTIARLSSLAQQFPSNGSAHYALACALIAAAAGTPNQTETAEIEKQLKSAIALDARIADAHFRLASFYAAHEQIQLAIKEYRVVLDQDPRIVEAHYRLSQLYARSGEPLLAKEQLQLHQELRAQEKVEIESGKVPIRISEAASCP